MKINSIRILLASTLVAFIFSGCKKSDTNYFASEYQNMMRENALLEAAFDDILKVSENILMNNNDAKIEATGAPLGCITEIDTVVTGSTSKKYTINFSTSCTVYDGKSRSGTLVVELNGTNYNTDGSSLTIHLNNFFINGNQIQGKLVCTNLGSGVFKVVVSDEAGSGWASLTFSSGKASLWKSTHKRTIYEGNTDAVIINNKYKISAFDEAQPTFEGVTTDTRHYIGTPENDLLLDYGCIASGNLRYPLDGEISFILSNFQRRTVDYGDGTCDYTVTMISGSFSQGFDLY